MIVEVSKKMTACFLKNHIIDEDQQGIYIYGLQLLFSTMLSTVAILLVGLIFHRLWYTLFLLIPFYNIRVYAGGIHAETYCKCILSFTIGFLFILLATEYLIYIGGGRWIITISVFSAILICIISPVEDHSRPLSFMERKVYNKKTCIMTILYEIVILIIYHKNQSLELVYAATSINTILLVLTAGIIKNKIIGFNTQCI